MNWPKYGKPLALALLLLAGLAYGFWPRPLAVELATAARGPLRVTVEEEGKTRVIDRYLVSAPVAGVACRIELRIGDPVHRDQALVALEPLASEVLDPRRAAEARARAAAAESALAAARERARALTAEADLAASELQRLQRLAGAGHVTGEDLDRARGRADSAAASLRSAQFAAEVAGHELDAARTALTYSAARAEGPPEESVVVRSPIDGVVLAVPHQCRGVVGAGHPLIELGDVRALEVVVEVLSEDAVRIAEGSEVDLQRWGGSPALQGRVRRIEPVGHTKVSALGVEEQRVAVVVDIISPPADWARLGDGYRLQAEFVLWQAPDVLQVPANALFRHGDGWAVFVAANGRARLRAVRPGQTNALSAEILQGLRPGEQVILHPRDEIADGHRVRPR